MAYYGGPQQKWKYNLIAPALEMQIRHDPCSEKLE
jgi:hypothetical protein